MARRQIGQEVLMFGDPVSERSRTLDGLAKMLDWSVIDTALSPIYASTKGEEGWPPLALFKALLLSIWYDLSDERLAEALVGTPINAQALAACPVYSNVTARPHEQDAGSIRQRLAEQLTHPVRWALGCQNMVADGLSEGASWHELAPGKSLAGMMKRIDRSVGVTIHDGP